MCVCTLLIYTAFVLGTTPKGDTGEGPNWAYKRDCLLETLMTLVFLRQMDTPPLWFGKPQVIPSIILSCSPLCLFISQSGLLMLTGKALKQFASET